MTSVKDSRVKDSRRVIALGHQIPIDDKFETQYIPIMLVVLRFRPNDHAWSRVVGIHRYNNVPDHQLGPGVPVDLVHNPANPVDDSAIQVLRRADGAMIGHLRYQVADVIEEVLQLGWSVTGTLTAGTTVFTDIFGRAFTECGIEIVLSCDDHQDFYNVVFLINALQNKTDDYPYDRV